MLYMLYIIKVVKLIKNSYVILYEGCIHRGDKIHFSKEGNSNIDGQGDIEQEGIELVTYRFQMIPVIDIPQVLLLFIY